MLEGSANDVDGTTRSFKEGKMTNTYKDEDEGYSDNEGNLENLVKYDFSRLSQDTDASKKSVDEIRNRDEINILLLSETGVGKSTFINAIATYLTHKNIETAESRPPPVLIPSKFNITDKNGTRRHISVGEDHINEFLNIGDSATQDVHSYIFPVGKNHPNIRLIDTPGMGDTRGPEQDKENCDYILNYLSNLKELHGICCLFKPSHARSTVYFQYCITELLSRLDKSASKNIVFIFTNTRGSNYSSGDTYDILKKLLDDIWKKSNVQIPLNKNVFCFDNEAFRYVAALHKGVKFNAVDKEKYRLSWKKSYQQFWRLIKYIKGIKPHLVQSTKAVNEARRMINYLAQPLADISELLHDNILILQRHQEKLDIENMTLDQLKNELFMPVVDIQLEELVQPATVCTSLKCTEIYQVGDKNKWHYKTTCHQPCHVKNVQAETVNNSLLLVCSAFDRKTESCKVCGCNYLLHMHVYYMTTTVEKRIENVNALKNIDNTEKFLVEVNKLINDMVVRKEELMEEHNTIVASCAKFTHFLQKNAITSFNDNYKAYIEYLISREISLGNTLANNQSIAHMREMLQTYEETKKLFDSASQFNDESSQGTIVVTSTDVIETMQKLYGLKHTGKKIEELYKCQLKARTNEHRNTEYIHSLMSKTGKETRKKNKRNKKLKAERFSDVCPANQEPLTTASESVMYRQTNEILDSMVNTFSNWFNRGLKTIQKSKKNQVKEFIKNEKDGAANEEPDEAIEIVDTIDPASLFNSSATFIEEESLHNRSFYYPYIETRRTSCNVTKESNETSSNFACSSLNNSTNRKPDDQDGLLSASSSNSSMAQVVQVPLNNAASPNVCSATPVNNQVGSMQQTTITIHHFSTGDCQSPQINLQLNSSTGQITPTISPVTPKDFPSTPIDFAASPNEQYATPVAGQPSKSGMRRSPGGTLLSRLSLPAFLGKK